MLSIAEVSDLTTRRFVRAFDRSGELAWEDEGPDDEVGRALAIAPDGGAFVCDDGPSQQYHRLTRFGPNGEVAWSTMGATGCRGMAITDSGVVVVGGATELSRFDVDGERLSDWPVDGPGSISDVAVDGDAVVLLGYRDQVGFWVARIDEDGQLAWVQEIGSTEEPAYASAIAVTESRDVVVVGHDGLFNGGPVGVPVIAGLWRLSAEGELRWAVAEDLGQDRSITLDDVVVAPDGGLMVTGGITSSSIVVAAFADDGELRWWEGGDDDYRKGNALAVDSCGAVHVVGAQSRSTWVGRFTPPDR